VTGFSSYSGTVLNIDGTAYDFYTLEWKTFLWEKGSTHSVAASTPITLDDSSVYMFASWTNGNGLSGASGTFTVPNSDSTVTVNYAIGSVRVTFASSTVPNYNGNVLTIDGTPYTYYNLPSFLWVAGTTHTITASTPLTTSDDNIYHFSSWTYGTAERRIRHLHSP
jgi:hypothetical protein